MITPIDLKDLDAKYEQHVQSYMTARGVTREVAIAEIHQINIRLLPIVMKRAAALIRAAIAEPEAVRIPDPSPPWVNKRSYLPKKKGR